MHQRRESMGSVTPTEHHRRRTGATRGCRRRPHAVTARPVAVGFCMSGGLTHRARQGDTRTHRCRGVDPRRVAVRDTPSPHLDVGGVQAEVYLRLATTTNRAGPTRSVITVALDAAGVVSTVELLTDAGTASRRGTAVGQRAASSCTGSGPLVAATQPLTQQRRAASVGATVGVGGARDGGAELGLDEAKSPLPVAPAGNHPGVEHPEVTAGDVRAVARVGSRRLFAHHPAVVDTEPHVLVPVVIAAGEAFGVSATAVRRSTRPERPGSFVRRTAASRVWQRRTAWRSATTAPSGCRCPRPAPLLVRNRARRLSARCRGEESHLAAAPHCWSKMAASAGLSATSGTGSPAE